MNFVGNIYRHKVKTQGKTVWAYDARKRYKGPDGKRRQKFKRCWSKAEAQATLLNFQTEIEEEFADAVTDKGKNRTFGELVEYYRKEYVKPAVFRNGRKVSGFKSSIPFLNTVLDQLKDAFGQKRIKDISYEDVKRFKHRFENTKTERGDYPAVSTVNERLSILRRLFNIAIQKYWLDISPFKRGPSLIDKAAENKRDRILTFEEEKRLLRACVDPQTIVYERTHKDTGEPEEVTMEIPSRRTHLVPLIICALDTAMRVGEIFGLTWEQIDFDKKVIYLTGRAAEKTKTGVAGILPMTDRLHDILQKRYRNQNPETKVFKRFEYKRAFGSACDIAGIKDFQLRDCRATAITRILMSGMSGDVVRKISRHTSEKVFLENYVRIDEQNAQKVGESLNRFIEKETQRVDDTKKPLKLASRG